MPYPSFKKLVFRVMKFRFIQETPFNKNYLFCWKNFVFLIESQFIKRIKVRSIINYFVTREINKIKYFTQGDFLYFLSIH